MRIRMQCMTCYSHCPSGVSAKLAFEVKAAIVNAIADPREAFARSEQLPHRYTALRELIHV